MATSRSLQAALGFLLLNAWGLQPPGCAGQAPSLSQPGIGILTPTTVEDSLAKARDQLSKSEYVEAEASVRSYLLKTPDSAEAHFLLGYILFREIQSHAVDIADLTRPDRQKSFVDLRGENARKSLAEYTAGAQLHAPSAFDLKIVALDYILLNDYPDADKWMTKALDWNPSDEQSWYYEGRIKFKQAEYTRAIEAFNHALQLDPRDIKAEDNLALAYEGLGKASDALAAYQKAIEWTRAAGSTDDEPWVNLGSLLTAQSRAQEAVSCLSEAIHLRPNDLRAYEMLAEAYRALERWPEVQATLERAVALSPNSASLHFMLARAYRRNGDLEKARIETQKTVELKEAEPPSTAGPE
jgi:tetratricopeptide (TPR) repeat protein